ncbi:tRNA dihydrouridine synthase [Ciborinia camelliae]|nr:tRNA dihydrouridine synthase [Ciborinia camelliae]
MTVSNDLPAVEAAHPESIISEKHTNGSSNPSKKLHGRSFYESIGSPKFILAPMVDQSEFAWRMLSRSFMSPESNKSLLAYTPMLHARMFSETPKFRDAHFQPLKISLVSQLDSSSPASSDELFLDGNPGFDRPLFVQFCANDEKELLEGAKYVAPFCDAVDLNLGCPQGIARKGKYGAFLQEDQGLIFKLINTLHKELDVPVTAKIRILETREKTLEYAKMVLSAGASILTVHGRTREMKGHKTGLADWRVLRFLRESLPKEVVLFANGNILAREDIDECLKVTGADGVMSAEGNLYDPTIFSDAPAIGEEGREYWRSLDGKMAGWRMDAVLRRYLDIIYKYVLQVSPPDRKPLFLSSDPTEEMKEEVEEEEEEGPPKKKQKGEKKEKTTSPSLVAMQPHCFKLLRPLVSKHHGIRDALAKCRAGDIQAFENVLQMTEKVVKEGILEYERTNGESYREEVERAEKEREEKMKGSGKGANGRGGANGDGEGKGGEDLEFEESSLETVRRCKRPWWVVQAYVRPLPMEALAKGSLTLSRKERGGNVKGKGEVGEAEEEGKVEVQVVGDKEGSNTEKESVEVPKDGLVCG